MTEHKNTILAIVLSLVVVVGWHYFVGYPQMEKQRQEALLKQQEQARPQPLHGASQPGASQPGAAQPATPAPQAGQVSAPPVPGGSAAPGAAPSGTPTREGVVTASPRVMISTPTLNGSIDLEGRPDRRPSAGQYRETVDPKITRRSCCSRPRAPGCLLRGVRLGGGRGHDAKCRVPIPYGRQEVTGALDVGHPVMLSYDNGDGLDFRRTIAVDDNICSRSG